MQCHTAEVSAVCQSFTVYKLLFNPKSKLLVILSAFFFFERENIVPYIKCIIAL